jgi:hypothetical protein
MVVEAAVPRHLLSCERARELSNLLSQYAAAPVPSK